LMKRGPVTVNAARIGEPTLTDPAPVTAPAVHAHDTALFIAASKGEPLPPVAPAAPAATSAASNAPAAGANSGSGSTLQLENVPAAENSAPASSGPAIGASIVSPSESSGQDSSGQPAPGTRVGPPVTPDGAAAAAAAAGVPGAQNPGGLQAVQPANNQALPPIEKPAEAVAQTNDVQHPAAQVQTGTDTGTTANGKKKKKKNPAPKYDSSSESSSQHKQKTGIDKLNPF
jgi:outer membrane protein assembly factor BamD